MSLESEIIETVEESDSGRPHQFRSRTTGDWLNQDGIKEVKRFNDFRTIDWVEDELDEHKKRLMKRKHVRIGTSSFKDRLLVVTQNWILLAAMGITIGLIAGCLNIITAWLGSVRVGHCSSNFYLSKAFCCWGQDEEKCQGWNSWSSYTFFNYLMYVGISLCFSTTSAVLVKHYAPSAAGSGISEIKCIVSGFVMEGFLGWWTLLIKSIGLPLAIASGLSVGKEGPSVHYAVSVGNSIAKLVQKYRKSASKAREFLTATSAAGVAVAFGSPMGGVLFSIEEISSVFQLSTIWKSYFCSLIAVATLAAVNPFRTGQLVLFEVTYDTQWHYFEIPLYIILGIFGGVYGIVVSKFNIRVVAFRKKYLGNFAIREVFILSLFTASFSYFNEYLRLDMTESMQILFHECDVKFSHSICDPNSKKTPILASLIFATIARMGLTIITYGCKVPAGIFVPSMAAGATFGRALGIIVNYFYQEHKDSSIFSTCPANGRCIIPGTYAFLGAAAGLSGITDLTVTVVIIMFELTGALRFILPTMIVVAITKAINDKWGHGGIADQMIKFNGLPHIDAKEEFTFDTTVESAMSTVVVTFPCDIQEAITLEQLKQTLSKTTFRGYPLIQSSANPKIVGFVSRADLEYVIHNYDGVSDTTKCNFSNTDRSDSMIDFKPILNRSPLTVNIDCPLEYVLEVFVKMGPRYILIENEGNLVGIITRKDILRFEYSLHSLHTNTFEQQLHEAFDAKVWEIMNYFSRGLRKNSGRLLYNDENRFM
ncbi:voltage-gated chloride channel [Scheffersomyces stipitis CBS 6054]|uniref:Chloride channel protein n=1 Tax=Scheffersomyces stipitis (strain ATCC 58785 / CBS 6054 / NBRC 10063 / NRRL Y-11545) TaxID=322104 RepID=A3GHK6_PICST|nr:voltage-gated chloride channel [Scheffersomyces stipitis CBS 6054]EAZ63070.2 voltage-gated chloride channel [Scheffersomyces stipitis CBS 6054]